jgi:hypothetical protein
MAMNTRKLTLLFTALVGLAVSAFAQSTPNEATVARVTGTVTATLADGSTVAVTEGTKLPQGATITTGDKSEAYLVNHGDTTSVITANSVVEIAELSTTSSGGKVTELKTTLDLKSGNLVAKLNPAKKSVNQYSIRTPKGVAAARGTVFTVSYNGTSYSIAVINGNVFIQPTAGSGARGAYAEGVNIPQGNAALGVGEGGTTEDGYRFYSVAELAANGSNSLKAELSQLLSVAVATVAVAAEKNIGGTTAAELRQVADAVIKADPSAAPAVAALVAASAPTQSQAIIDSTKANAPAQSTAVQEAVRTSTPTTTTNPTTGEKTTTPQTTAPQAIDPATVSRSGE